MMAVKRPGRNKKQPTSKKVAEGNDAWQRRRTIQAKSEKRHTSFRFSEEPQPAPANVKSATQQRSSHPQGAQALSRVCCPDGPVHGARLDVQTAPLAHRQGVNVDP